MGDQQPQTDGGALDGTLSALRAWRRAWGRWRGVRREDYPPAADGDETYRADLALAYAGLKAAHEQLFRLSATVEGMTLPPAPPRPPPAAVDTVLSDAAKRRRR